jgi:hypothetical protein
VFDFKNYVLKIMPKSLSEHLGRLQGKLKLTEKEKNPHIPQCTIHQPTSVAYKD